MQGKTVSVFQASPGCSWSQHNVILEIILTNTSTEITQQLYPVTAKLRKQSLQFVSASHAPILNSSQDIHISHMMEHAVLGYNTSASYHAYLEHAYRWGFTDGISRQRRLCTKEPSLLHPWGHRGIFCLKLWLLLIPPLSQCAFASRTKGTSGSF